MNLKKHAGAWGAGVILPPCAQLLWCELYVIKSIHKQKNKKYIHNIYAYVYLSIYLYTHMNIPATVGEGGVLVGMREW